MSIKKYKLINLLSKQTEIAIKQKIFGDQS